MDSRSGILDGKEEVREFLKGPGDQKLKKYLESGMPVLIENGRWLAHKENIEEFFKTYTRQKVKVNPDKMPGEK
jgi:hypothetical protein